MAQIGELTISMLGELIDGKKWDVLLNITEDYVASNVPSVYFARAKALLELDRASDALNIIALGRTLSPGQTWGVLLEFEALLTVGDIDKAFNGLGNFILSSDNCSEIIKRTFIDKAMEHNRFDDAVQINETRENIQPRQKNKHVVALQCFNKPDTIDKVLAALSACGGTEAYDLVIFQDSPIGSSKEDQYTLPTGKVRETIACWLPLLMSKFGSVQVTLLRRNRGTAPTCRQLLDEISYNYEGFVFIEDDCILSTDALRWAKHQLDVNIGVDKFWFSTCESIYFNSRDKEISQDYIRLLYSYAQKPDVHSSYVTLDFVPSTCFITNRDVWNRIKSVRSFPRGPESLTKYMRLLGKQTVFPVVPRASDIGMLHELGYSVAMLGKDNVKEIKQTYLLSDGLFDEGMTIPYKGNTDLLFSATSNINLDHIRKLIDL